MAKTKKNSKLLVVTTTAVISLSIGGITKVQADNNNASSISSSSTVTAAVSTSSQEKSEATTLAEQTKQVLQASKATSASSVDESTNSSEITVSSSSEASSAKSIATSTVSSTTATATSKSEAAATTATQTTPSATAETSQSTITAENDVLDGNTIILPSDYGTALEAFYKSGSEDDSALIELVADSLNQNTYKTNIADANVQISDIDNLSQAQREELSVFAAELINQVRNQLGTVNVTVSKGALDFAQAVAKRYDSDNWDLYNKDEHDVAGISAVASEYGLATGNNYYEDLSEGFLTTNITTGKISLDDIKAAIYNTITYMLFADSGSNWQHSMSITNVAHYSTTDSMEYFAFATDKYGQIHLEIIAPDLIQDATKFDTTVLSLYSDEVSQARSISDKTAIAKKKSEVVIGQNKGVMVNNSMQIKQVAALITNKKIVVNKANMTKVKTARTLPQTGTTNNGILSSIGAIIIAIAGFLGLKLRKRMLF